MSKFDYKLGDETFVNPYNFVAVDWENKETQNCENIRTDGNLITGYMDCSILAKSPVAIPDAERKSLEKEEHVTYPFLRDPQGRYMIPGSSIRGMLRSVYETATDSCFSTMRERTGITIRQGSRGALRPGLLIKEGGRWQLFEATRYMLKSKEGSAGNNQRNKDVWDETKCPVYRVNWDDRGKYITYEGGKVRSGEQVSFEVLMDCYGKVVQYRNRKGISCGMVASRILPPSEQGKEGFLVLGEEISGKHHESIFEKEGQRQNISDTKMDRALKGLEETLKVYRNAGTNKKYRDPSEEERETAVFSKTGGTEGDKKKHTGYCDYERMKEKGSIPVWWMKVDNRLYLSFAAIGRIAFASELNDLAGKKIPCTSREHLCAACHLFGMAQKDGEQIQAVGSRVRVTDACGAPENKYRYHPLPELGTPRISYLPFYVNARNLTGQGKDTYGYDEAGAELKGRKFYWHAKYRALGRQEKTKQNSTVEAAENGSRSSFRIYFDGVTKRELKELVWCVTLGENDRESLLCHKIGHGKPVGLGSVKITVDAAYERNFTQEQGVWLKPMSTDPDGNCPFDESTETIKQLKKICTFNAVGRVSYPYIASEEDASKPEFKNYLAAHSWYTQNKNNKELQTLPEIGEEQSLQVYVATLQSKQGNNKRYGNTQNRKKKGR